MKCREIYDLEHKRTISSFLTEAEHVMLESGFPFCLQLEVSYYAQGNTKHVWCCFIVLVHIVYVQPIEEKKK